MMRAAQQREVAAIALQYAINGNFREAAAVRQRAYALDMELNIYHRWDDFEQVWESDSKYLKYLDEEGFSDLDNSETYIQSLKAGIFIDYLFTFRDSWGVREQERLSSEKISCPSLEEFLKENELDFESVGRVYIYARTKHKNANARMWFDAVTENGTYQKGRPTPRYFSKGKYDLGFYEEPTPQALEGLRRHEAVWDLYNHLSAANISGFPKTFNTFDKHRQNNSEKYQRWLEEYRLSADPQYLDKVIEILNRPVSRMRTAKRNHKK